MTTKERVEAFRKIFKLEKMEKFNLIFEDGEYCFNPAMFVDKTIINSVGDEVYEIESLLGEMIFGKAIVEKIS